MNKTYRIKDIANLSGVSTGTVDRILHHRGKVSPEAKEKVDKVLKEINYQPNLIARSLALKKKYNFIIVTPMFSEGEYWAKLAEGVDQAEQELFSYNITIQHLYFSQYDNSSFDALIPIIEQANCQGVVLATLFQDSVLKLTTRLDTQNIPYVLIDSYIDHTNCIAYYGTHSYNSGYIAGRLLFEQISKDEDIAVFRFIRKGCPSSAQVTKREEGFCDYLYNNNYQGRMHSVQIHGEGESEKENISLLKAFFETGTGIKAGIIFNSRAYLLGKYFEELNVRKDFKLIGYDVLEKNIEYLNGGLITYLIAQRPEVQGIHSVKALFRHLILEKDNAPINYMPIDILVKENISYYNNYI